MTATEDRYAIANQEPGSVPNRFVPGPTWTSHQFVDDLVMDDQFRHHLSLMLYGMSDLGECLEVARHLRPGDEESWMQAWTAMAERLTARAEDAERRGKAASAASIHLRAATYWRASLMHFGFEDDPRVNHNALASNRCYTRYLELSGYPGRLVEIPYEGTFLYAHFYTSPNAGPKAPLLIFNQGRDAWPEDTRWVYDNAIKRGIHCLAFHGPGQGLSLRMNKVHFRHDWENVIGPVIDFGLQQPGVDPDRIAVMGLSFGGYLAPRSAVFDKRIKLCIANPGVITWGESVMSGFPPPILDAYKAGRETFNALVGARLESEPTHGWFIRDAMFKHGVSTPYDLFEDMLRCDLTDLAKDITCETLVIDSTEEVFSTGQPQRLFDALVCPKELMRFDEASTAQLHCQNGANATAGEMIFDWIDERL